MGMIFFFFRILNVGVTQKRHFYIFDVRNIKPAAAMLMSSSPSFSLKQHFMY